MRVIFMGGKQIGCNILDYLSLACDTKVVGVFVNPNDMAPNRWYPSAAQIAIDYDIPVFTGRINKPKSLAHIKGLAPQIIVVAYYDQILSREVFEIPERCINVHLAKAERYRGCHPTTWALLNGDKETGVTIHHVTDDVDGGDIIAERPVLINDWETGATLYYRCTGEAARLFREIWPLIIAGKAPRRKQQTTMHTQTHHRPFPSQKIDFYEGGYSSQIINHIRAMTFAPFPPPYFMIGDKKYEVRPVD